MNPSQRSADEESTIGGGGPVGPNTWGSELFRAEYESLREESARAHDSQHRILQWSLAAYGALFLAALALTDAEPQNLAARGEWSDPYLMQLGFFLIVLPLLLTASMLLWLAELYRIERVGAYLRTRERCWWKEPLPASRDERARCLSSREYPMMWENMIYGPVKEFRNFATGFFLYALALLFTIFVFAIVVWPSDRSLEFKLLTSTVAGVVLLVYFLGIPWKFARDLKEVRRHFPENRRQYVDDQEPPPRVARWFYKVARLSGA